jgi:lipoyl(octanoyl) transferase
MTVRAAWIARPRAPVAYDAANDAMHALAEQRLADLIPDTVLLVEHPPVFTAGRRAKPDELRWDEATVTARGGMVRRIDRGGSFTFHGPGQLVVYPIVDLGVRPDVAAYLRRLEEVAIRAAADLGVALGRRSDIQTGVWSGEDKVGAIGVRLLRTRVTLHGLAINCDTDLGWFEGIVACGLPDHGATSLTRLSGRRIGVGDALPAVERRLAEVFELEPRRAPAEILAMLGDTADVA